VIELVPFSWEYSEQGLSCANRGVGVTKFGVGVAIAVALAGPASPAFAGTTTYKYNALGRVIEVDYPDGSKVFYSYDTAGDRTSTTRQAGV